MKRQVQTWMGTHVCINGQIDEWMEKQNSYRKLHLLSKQIPQEFFKI